MNKLEIVQRSMGYVSQEYYDAKKILMANRKRGFCIICGNELPKKRRLYCSDECFSGWFQQFNPKWEWPTIRHNAFKRDDFKCVKCGKKEGDDSIYGGSVYLIGDHINPIALGGSEWDLSNIQTLCSDCNKIKTRDDIKKISKLREIIKISKGTHPIDYFSKNKKESSA